MRRRSAHRRLWGAAAVALAGLCGGLGACRGCGRATAPQILSLADPNSEVVVWVPSLAAMAVGTRAYLAALLDADQPTLRQVRERLVAGMAADLGRNLLEPKDLAAMGLVADGGLVAWSPAGGGEGLLAVEVSAPERLLAAVADLARRRAGADQSRRSVVEGAQVTTFGRPFGDDLAPVLHLAILAGGRRAIFAAGDGLGALTGAAAAAAAADRAPDPWAGLWRRLPAARVLVARPPAGVVTLDLDETGITGEAWWAQPAAATSATGSVVPRAALGHLSESALAAACGALTPEVWAAIRAGHGLLGRLPPLRRLAEQLAAAAGDPLALAAQAQLRGAWAASLEPAERGAAPAAGGLARTVLRYVQVVGMAQVVDPAALMAALLALEAQNTAAGQVAPARAGRAGERPVTLHELPIAGAPVWALTGDRLWAGAPDAAVLAGIAREGQRASALAARLEDGAAGPFLDVPGWLAVLRGGRIADAVAGARGGGGLPQGAGLGALVDAAAALLRRLGDVAVHQSEADGGLRLRLRQRLPTPPAAGQAPPAGR